MLVAHDKIGSDQRFDSADLRLAEQFAVRAAIAVDLSRRVARDALRRVVAGQEVERRRLARELHDETGQALDLDPARPARSRGGGRATSSPKSVSDLRELVVSTLQDVRRSRCSSGRRRSTTSVSCRHSSGSCRRSRRRAASPFELEAQLGDERLPADVETTLYRIIQEALTNVVKHAEATQREHSARAAREAW